MRPFLKKLSPFFCASLIYGANNNNNQICRQIPVEGTLKTICVDNFRSSTQTSSLRIKDEDLIQLIAEIEEKRQAVIASYYDKEKEGIEQEKLAQGYVLRLKRYEQLADMHDIQKQRDNLNVELKQLYLQETEDPLFYELASKLKDLDDQYKAAEEVYATQVATLQAQVDTEVKAAREALAAGGLNDSWELFEMGQKGFTERRNEILNSPMTIVEKNQALRSIESAINDLEMMAISVAAVKHLRCERKVNPDVSGDPPVLPESYALFRSGASMFIAAQINQTTDQKITINQIKNKVKTTPQTLANNPANNIVNTKLELNKQLVNIKIAGVLMQHQVKAIDLRHATKNQALKLFKSAYAAALLEHETKNRKLLEIDRKIEGANVRKSYNKGKKDNFILALVTALPSDKPPLILGRDKHKARETTAKANLIAYKKEKQEYLWHGHLTCKGIGLAGIPPTTFGKNSYRERGKQFLGLFLATAHGGTQEQGLAMKSGTEMYKYFIETKKQELYNESNAACALSSPYNIPDPNTPPVALVAQETSTRGQIQAFPFPCHRAEYLSKVISYTATNVQDMRIPEKDTSVDRRNTFLTILKNTRVRLGIPTATTQGTPTPSLTPLQNSPQQQVQQIQNLATDGDGVKDGAILTTGFKDSGLGTTPPKLNKFKKYNELISRSIKENRDNINRRLEKSGRDKVNFSNRATQLRINSRRANLNNFLNNNKNKNGEKNGLLKDLLKSGGSFNQEDVMVANKLNQGPGKRKKRNSNNANDNKKQIAKEKKKIFDNDAFLDKYLSQTGVNSSSGRPLRKPSSSLEKDNNANDKNDKNLHASLTFSKAYSKRMFEEIDKNKKLREKKGDSIFKRITKAYFLRAYPIFFK